MKIFVACSGADAVGVKYRTLAVDVATTLVRNGEKLVFGGSDAGLMGKCYMTYKYEGGKVKGICDITNSEDMRYLELDACEVAPSTFDRTKMLYTSSDVVLVLPGGIGTLSELFGIIEEIKTKRTNIPVVLFNYDNFYTPLLKFLENIYKEGFVNKSDLQLISIVTDVKSLELYLKNIDKKEER